MVGRILTLLKDEDLDRLLPSRRQNAVARHNAITLVRQEVEWGMGWVEKIYHASACRCPTTPTCGAFGSTTCLD